MISKEEQINKWLTQLTIIKNVYLEQLRKLF